MVGYLIGLNIRRKPDHFINLTWSRKKQEVIRSAYRQTKVVYLLPKGSPCILSGQFLNINLMYCPCRHTKTRNILSNYQHLTFGSFEDERNLEIYYFFKSQNLRKFKIVKMCSISCIDAIIRTVFIDIYKQTYPPPFPPSFPRKSIALFISYQIMN